MKCRICQGEIPAGSAVYVSSTGKRTPDPACRGCVEREVRESTLRKPQTEADWRRLAGGQGTRKRTKKEK